MFQFNKTAIGIAAGVAGTIFLGYCIYFDHKRRSDPEYKKKVRERRRRNLKKGSAGGKSGMPNLNDHEAIERYFLQEIQLGETLIGRGDFEQGVEHLANAIVVCGQPARLLQVLQTTLPSQVFAMLIMKMQQLSSRSGNADADDTAKNPAVNPMGLELGGDGGMPGTGSISMLDVDDLE